MAQDRRANATHPTTVNTGEPERSKHFIQEVIEEDLRTGTVKEVVTRWPPEPNGYMHIGHAKALCLDFGMPEMYGGRCHLRFDDTNPEKEEVEFVEAIKDDLHWMEFDWGEHEYFASDYFERLYDFAVRLVKMGKAYVDHLTPDQLREYRGTLTEPGKNSPYRDRSVEENLSLLEKMRAGGFDEGECVLRAKIDMASPNMNMRDPTIYRIKKQAHHRTGTDWCIYPMYDFSHCLSDAIEAITHSLCSLEYEDHRPLYDWFIETLETDHRPHQYEFARFNMTYTIMSKRWLRKLVEEGCVAGWDDPRMPTLRGLRRRGYTPAAIKEFIDRVGVAKKVSTVDYAMLEYCIKDELNRTTGRYMAVLNPLKVTVVNYPEGRIEWMDAENNPEDESAGTRTVPFSRNLYIERDDYLEDAPKKWYRFSLGREVRLKHGYYLTCTEVKKDPATGEPVELLCTYDPASRGGWTEDGRKVRGTSHWLAAEHAITAEVRVYDHLFSEQEPGAESGDFIEDLNPDSLKVLTDALVEPALAEVDPETRVQFLRQGYFVADKEDHKPGAPVFNRITPLRDTWAKLQKKMG